MQHSPLAQFEIKNLVNLTLHGYDVSITNSAACMFIITMFSGILLLLVSTKSNKVPSRLQASGELMYGFIADMLQVNVGKEGQKFVAFIFSFFWFILVSNLLGLIPYSFTVTSHIVVTFTLAALLFVIINIYGVAKNGLSFFTLFLPRGTPLWMAPLMVIIELFAYLTRPVSLALRLVANMIAGHVLLKVIAGFAVALGVMFKVVPTFFIGCFIGLEFFVALLQAYIFTLLACVYINDAVNLH
jgi:F-type H+-transporting ATPase subunit a